MPSLESSAFHKKTAPSIHGATGFPRGLVDERLAGALIKPQKGSLR